MTRFHPVLFEPQITLRITDEFIDLFAQICSHASSSNGVACAAVNNCQKERKVLFAQKHLISPKEEHFFRSDIFQQRQLCKMPGPQSGNNWNMWKFPLYMMYILLFIIYWDKSGKRNWLKNTTRVLCVLIHIIGISAITIDLVYKIHIFYIPNLVPIIFGYYSSMMFYIAAMACLFVCKSFWTNKLSIILGKLNFEKTCSRNLKAKMMIIFTATVAGSLSYLFLHLFFKISMPPPVLLFVAEHHMFLVIAGTVYFAYVVYLTLFSMFFLLFFVGIFTILTAELKELRSCLVNKIANNKTEDLSLFTWFTEEYTNTVNLVQELESWFSFDFILFVGFTLNNFMCGVYAVTYVNECHIPWDFFKLNMVLSIAYFILFALPAASVYSEVYTQTLPSNDIYNCPKESHGK